MKTTGLPLLFVALLLLIGGGITLLVQEPADPSDLWAAVMLLSTGLVVTGSWLAVEIKGIRTSTMRKTPTDYGKETD